MASPAQIEANRRNAKRSSGPKTEAGRAIASQNALRHGLTARQLVIFDESEEDFAGFHRETREALAPADAMEEALVDRIILCAWRLRRAGRAEAAMLDANADYCQRRSGGEPARINAVFNAGRHEMDGVTRYEAAIERSLHRAMASLERRQARRAGEPIAAPIVVAGDSEVVTVAAPRDVTGIVVQHENYETKPILPPSAEPGSACTSENSSP